MSTEELMLSQLSTQSPPASQTYWLDVLNKDVNGNTCDFF